MLKRLLLLLMFLLLTGTAWAQEMTTIETTVVEREAADGLLLQGDFYAHADPAPTVLLMHMLGSSRGAWEPIIPDLLNAGYNVLAVDLRGHGETGGRTDWEAAVTDVQTWLDWLREQDVVIDEAISIIGASIGSNLALIGCANDAACVTAIALSPGLDYRGVMPEEAVVAGLAERSALLVAAQQDFYSADSVKQMASNARGEIGLRLFTGRAHGTELFSTDDLRARVSALIIHWLDEHQPAPA